MSRMGQYLFSVLTAALATSLVGVIFNGNKSVGSIIKFISGIFLGLTVISPILNVQSFNISDYFSSLTTDAEIIADTGSDFAAANQKAIIMEQASAYVLEKAKALNLDITAQLEFGNENIPIPKQIYLNGNVSPYAKKELTHFIAEQLGIPEENQVWN